MPPKQKYTDPKLREEVKEEIKQSDKGGEPGQWSARKAQMMASEYKKRGGDYKTPKSDKDESAKHLDKWTEEEWQTKDGEGEAKKSDGNRKRYLPKKAWEEMDEGEKKETDKKKQAGSKKGQQYVANTGRAKQARKEAHEDEGEEEKEDDGEEQEEEEEKQERPARKRGRPKKDEQKEAAKEEPPAEQASKKRGRPKKQDSEEDDSKKDEPVSKKGKQTNGTSGKTVGSRHDKAEPPAQQASLKRLPKKGTSAYWKAMPGWVDGKVVEIVKADKQVDGKKVKATKEEPKIVLKSNSSGKICVHKVDNVYFD